jgi:nucleoside-diphosphate-sugar epimerase
MGRANSTVLVTGVSGNLGLRLLPLLADHRIVGVDLNPPQTPQPVDFVSMDFGREDSCGQLLVLLRQARPAACIHLAFVIDPVRTGILDVDHMWQVNVAGTARVMEAISEANRDQVTVEKFLFPSSVAVYGSDFSEPAREDFPLRAHSLPYAVHKMEAEQVVQQWAPALRGCSVYMLRPPILAGASVENYLLGAFRGTPNGRGNRAARMRAEGKRLPLMLPQGAQYLAKKIQFIHVDDMARLLAHIVHKVEPELQRLTVLNVAGRGEALTIAQCIQMANGRLLRVPGKVAFGLVLKLLWTLGISAIPPAALPYMTGQYIMDTSALRNFLNVEYESVIRYTIRDAFADSFAAEAFPKHSAAAG